MTAFFCGDGRSRTAVQTTPQRAFYTLIPPLVVDLGLPKGLSRASGFDDTPLSRLNRPKAGGIYVSAAALAALINAQFL